MPEISYREAIAAALREEMRRDPKTLIMGEDIGESGGPFKTCQGLYEEFGAARVRDTPISETGFVGAALGLALTGYRPIVEIMFADFLGVCFDQIANSIAKHRFMSGGRVKTPLVIRALGGAGLRFGAQHSQTAESWLLSVPGLKIICPSNPGQAYLMLKAAIRDDNPVLVLEHKALLSMKGPVPVGAEEAPMPTGPRIVRPGRHATIVASLAMVGKALAAADKLEAEGIEAEVIDIQVLRPLNVAPIGDSVRRTNILVTVEEQAPTGGWSSDVVADVVSQAFDYLDAPPARITLPDHPLPYSPHLEDALIPSPETDRGDGQVVALRGRMDFLVPKLSATMETVKVLRWLKQSRRQGCDGRAARRAGDRQSHDGSGVSCRRDTRRSAGRRGRGAVGRRRACSTPILGEAASRKSDEVDAATVAAAPAHEANAAAATPRSSVGGSGVADPRFSVREAARQNEWDRSGASGRRNPVQREFAGVTLSPRSRRGTRRRNSPRRRPRTSSRSPLCGVRSPKSVALSRKMIPSFVIDRWVETTAIDQARAPSVERSNNPTGIKPTLTDFLLLALAESFAAHPRILDRWHEENGRVGRMRASSVDIGLVVALSDGVMIPALRDLAGKSIR